MNIGRFKKPIVRILSAKGIGISRPPPAPELIDVLQLYRPRKMISTSLIRVGAKHDGGYLIPNCLDGVDVCFSPGVDRTADFESDLACRGIFSHLIDRSVVSPPNDLKYLSFTRKFIGVRTSGETVTLEDWISDVEPSSFTDAILQMDIEGAEYTSILTATKKLLRRFRIIVLELHGLASLSNRHFFRVFRDFSLKLTDTHDVVHLHPNNYFEPIKINGILIHPALEVSLLRKDMFQMEDEGYVKQFPNPLDSRCMPDRDEVALGLDWR